MVCSFEFQNLNKTCVFYHILNEQTVAHTSAAATIEHQKIVSVALDM